MMKAKLLHGIVKDLLKFPMHGGRDEHEPKDAAHITIVAAGKPEDEEGIEPDADDMGADPLEEKKHMMDKAIHAKMKHKI